MMPILSIQNIIVWVTGATQRGGIGEDGREKRYSVNAGKTSCRHYDLWAFDG
jgi:hypothetical protein